MVVIFIDLLCRPAAASEYSLGGNCRPRANRPAIPSKLERLRQLLHRLTAPRAPQHEATYTGGIVKPIAHSLSPEEYLELEKSLPLQHEFVGGVMYAMAGSSRRHNIVGNTFVELRRLAQGKPCRVFQSDMKLRIGEVFYYP